MGPVGDDRAPAPGGKKPALAKVGGLDLEPEAVTVEVADGRARLYRQVVVALWPAGCMLVELVPGCLDAAVWAPCRTDVRRKTAPARRRLVVGPDGARGGKALRDRIEDTQLHVGLGPGVDRFGADVANLSGTALAVHPAVLGEDGRSAPAVAGDGRKVEPGRAPVDGLGVWRDGTARVCKGFADVVVAGRTGAGGVVVLGLVGAPCVGGDNNLFCDVTGLGVSVLGMHHRHHRHHRSLGVRIHMTSNSIS